MEKTAFLITTRFLDVGEKWSDLSIQLPDKLVIHSLIKEKLKLAFKKAPTIKYQIIADTAITIYLAPCTAEGVENNVKADYLASLLSAIKKQYENILDNFYLLAHDKDFILGETDRDVNVAVVEERHLPENACPDLKAIVKKQHAFMFRHGNNKKMANIIDSQIDYFDKKRCEDLLSILRETSSKYPKMLAFFKDLCKSEKTRYPKGE